MRTSRLLIAFGAIQVLIMFTCMALPSLRSSSRKRSSSFALRSTLPSSTPSPFMWHVDEATPALQASMAIKMKPYELWLVPPTPNFRYVDPPLPVASQRASLPAHSSGLGQAHSSAFSSSSRKLNPQYAMKFNQEALKQQQQQQNDGSPISPSAPMFRSRFTTCAGDFNYRDITAVTHMSVDRVARLHDLEQRWPGPVAVAIYTRSHADDVAAQNMTQWLQRARVGRPTSGGWCIVVLRAAQPQLYPVNHIRNAAWNVSRTQHVFILDIDLVPDPGFYAALMRDYDSIERNSKGVYTIPAFELKSSSKGNNALLPSEWRGVMRGLQQGELQPILNDTFAEAFSCLDYAKWYQQSSLAAASSYAITYMWPCEPYVVGSSATMPRFDERFIHYGNDKAQHLLLLYFKRFTFHVLPRHFLVHKEHRKAGWADHSQRLQMLGDIMRLTEQFKFESGTNAGMNWRNGKELPVGTYRVKGGKVIEWNGKKWVRRSDGVEVDPLA